MEGRARAAVARTSLAVVLGAMGASCFSGADALGLPCRGDADCGQGQRCEQGLCGGPPATATTDGTSTTSEGQTGTSTSTGPDPTVTESTGPAAGCGNGVLEPELDEDCDPGPSGDAVDCDYDCTPVTCGDGYANLVAGEQCDDGNDALVDDCTPECRATLFWDDMEQDPALGDQWLPPEIPEWEYMGSGFSLDEGWRWGAPLDPGTWYSGPYSSTSGTARIISRLIDFPPDPGPGFRFELRLRHRLRFDGNPTDVGGCMPSKSDGGVVWLMTEDGTLRPAGPPPTHPDALDNEGECTTIGEPDNPLYDAMTPQPAYTGITGDFVETGFPLPPEVAGTTAHLVFEVGYDCDNCWATAPMGAGWIIDDVVVAPFPG